MTAVLLVPAAKSSCLFKEERRRRLPAPLTLSGNSDLSVRWKRDDKQLLLRFREMSENFRVQISLYVQN